MRNLGFGAIIVSVLCGCAAEYEPTFTSIPDYNQYWDGRRAPTVAASHDCSAAAMRSRFATYMKPGMMAIGDSIYNGVTSLHVNWWTAEWSAPALVAITTDLIHQENDDRRLRGIDGRQFWVPQYPGYGDPKFSKPGANGNAPQFGLDLESLPNFNLFNLAPLIQTMQRAAGDLEALSGRYMAPNGRYFADNIAFSGADTFDLLLSSADTFRARMTTKSLTGVVYGDRLHTLAANGSLSGMAAYADSFTNINAAFVLNPQRDDCIGQLTPLHQVLLRQPRRVLINIGSNNGIWSVAFNGQSLDEKTPIDDFKEIPGRGLYFKDVKKVSIREYLGKAYIDHMKEIIDKLSGDPSIEYVYINGLFPPSRIANLKPDDVNRRLPDGYYFEKYRPDFSTRRRTLIHGSVIKAADQFVAEQNQRVRALIDEANRRLGSDRKFRFIDVDALSKPMDFKHLRTSAARVRSCPDVPEPDVAGRCYGPHGLNYGKSLYLDNMPLHFSREEMRRKNGTILGYVLESGGLFSFDNMHLSSAGYGLLATWVADEIHRNEKDPAIDPSYFRNARRMISPHELYLARNYRANAFLRNGRPDDDALRESISRKIDFIYLFMGGRMAPEPDKEVGPNDIAPGTTAPPPTRATTR